MKGSARQYKPRSGKIYKIYKISRSRRTWGKKKAGGWNGFVPASREGFEVMNYLSFLRISRVWFQNISTVLISMRSSGLWTPRRVGP